MGMQCTECGAQVAADAERCPSCGAALPRKTKLLPIAAFMLIVILVISSYMKKEEQPPAEPAPAVKTLESQ
nr:zinc-ribbon domain-containing protein [uncultured Pseudomonas sp.]